MPIELSHDHVAIRAVDYAAAIAWYRDKLDFTVDQEWTAQLSQNRCLRAR